MDYGTFGMWAGLLAGGKIVLPLGYSKVRSPDMVWWDTATDNGYNNVEYVDISKLDVRVEKLVNA